MIQQTSLEAYGTVQKEVQRGRIYNSLAFKGEANIRMISNRLNLDVSSVCGRLDELRKLGLIKEAYKDYCPLTKRLTIFWGVA